MVDLIAEVEFSSPCCRIWFDSRNNLVVRIAPGANSLRAFLWRVFFLVVVQEL